MNIRFLSHALSGLASLRQAPAPGDARPTLPVSIAVKTSPDGTTTRDVSLTLTMHGPQDVTGLDPDVILRREPMADTQDFEPGNLAFVEFSDPGLPWLFSPDTAAPYKPWLVLLVVPDIDGVSVSHQTTLSNQVLELPDLLALAPEFVLPDLSKSAWWAHVQVMDNALPPEQLTDALAQDPTLGVSRLISPLRLNAETSYHTCLVPATLGGVYAGLREALPGGQDPLAPAWTASTTALRLPVYDHFEFRTGRAGDFISLANRLNPSDLAGLASGRQMRVDLDADGVPTASGLPWETAHQGVLAPTGAAVPEVTPTEVETALQDMFARGTQLEEDSGDPVVGPPVHGAIHAGEDAFPTAAPTWLASLNLDPRLRVAAGLGRKIIQQDQDALMASAWSQVGEIERLNGLLARAQGARSVTDVTHGRFEALPTDESATIAQLTAPQHRRVRAVDDPLTTRTASADMLDDPQAPGLVDPGLRRLLRRSSPVLEGESFAAGSPVAARVLLGSVELVPDPDASLSGLQPLVTYTGAPLTPFTTASPPDRTVVSSHVGEMIAALDPPGTTLETLLLQHLQAIQASESGALTPPALLPEPAAPVSLRNPILSGLDPERTFPAYVDARAEVPETYRSTRDRLDPVRIGPVFDHPMSEAMERRDLGMLFPGVGELPDNTTGLLSVNPDVLEAFMVGLNHEMARELLFRGFPSDVRATSFRQFWDVSTHVPKPTTHAEREALYDITALHTWASAEELGTHTRANGDGDQVVLAIRGELLRKYPETLVFAVPAKWVSGKRRPDFGTTIDDVAVFPSFRGQVPSDITLLGFPLTLMDVRGELDGNGEPDVGNPIAGHFFILQQPIGDTRLGLSEDVTGTPPSSWAELAWEHVELESTMYLDPTTPITSGPTTPAGVTYGAGEAASLGYILHRQPHMFAIHGDDLLGLG